MASKARHALPELVDIEEISQHLGVSVRHVRRLVSERRIPYFKWGRLVRFNPDDVERWLRSMEVEPRLADARRRSNRRLALDHWRHQGSRR